MTEATESINDVAAKRQEQQARYGNVAQARPGTTAQTEKARLEAMRIIHSQILDYRHEHPANLRKTIELLLKLCQNISDAPDDPKYRKVGFPCWPVMMTLCLPREHQIFKGSSCR